jgi:hypothetical protein
MNSMAASKLYYELDAPSAFSSLKHLAAAVGKQQQNTKQKKQSKPSEIKAWLETQDAYTQHTRVRKCFPRNRYAVNNMNDVWEIDLIDVQNLSKYNDSHKYLLSAIDVFSKYLHILPLKSKTGPAVASAFLSIFDDPKYKKPLRTRPIWVRTARGKEFLNTSKTR